MRGRSIILIYLILFCLIDTLIPIPFMGLLLVYVVLRKPSWFLDLVQRVYGRP
jgi:hypothetical protein